jgi:hypothetical protein
VSRASELYAYQHMLLRAFQEMNLSGVLTLNGIPTVYLRDEQKPINARVAAEAHRQFWNQGVATVLLLRDPEKIRVFSSMTTPMNPATATEADVEQRLVEELSLATQASWAQSFYFQLGTGHYYTAAHEEKFIPERTVDSYLLNNLAAVRDILVEQGLDPTVAHTFLGRLLFTCYLCDRGVIELPDYFKGTSWRHLHELLSAFADPGPPLYGTLFPALRREFNSSMFDDQLEAERALIKPSYFEVIRRFLHGDDLTKGKGQPSLGFWAYDFKFIPVETISAIYEDFLEREDAAGKHEAGAFYTPRFLAEMTLDLALDGLPCLYGEDRKFIDPACGSGLFLVLLFNRLAAEWRAAQTSEPLPQVQAEALLERLSSLRGVDKNPTACRIACFSLYLAFLDQFEPPGVRAYRLNTGQKLPNLLHLQQAKRAPQYPVVREADFLEIAPKLKARFDLVVGNPPWAGRGTKQIVHRFMTSAPQLLKEGGRACLVLPSKVFLNQTDAFQSRWLRKVTLKKVVQLADFRRILFKEAHCPCNIVLFLPRSPEETTHEIEYMVPKVSRVDLRDGVIRVAPQDRKWIPLRLLLGAAEQKAVGVAWKSHLWASPRDLKFLNYIFSLPRLGDLAGIAGNSSKRWTRGVGFQPLRPTSVTDKPKSFSWNKNDRFVTPNLITGLPTLPEKLTYELGLYLSEQGYRLDQLHRPRHESIYTPPLVLWNRGFTDAAFFDYKVRYQHALHSIAGPPSDSDYLIFLAVFLRSPLARYFVFHTAASLGTERDQVHMQEALRLPFFLPDTQYASPNASAIVRSAAAKLRQLKREMDDSAEILLKQVGKRSLGPLFGDNDDDTDAQRLSRWLSVHREKSRKLQTQLNPLVYDYFRINEQERALIEDTCDIFDRSDTPASLNAARGVPTLQPVEAAELEPYATALTNTLSSWSTGTVRVHAAGGVDNRLGLGLVELNQVQTSSPFQIRKISSVLANALQGLQDANLENWGGLEFRRTGLIFHNSHIYVVKPALRGQWSRIAALNDATEISAHIAEARRQTKR